MLPNLYGGGEVCSSAQPCLMELLFIGYSILPCIFQLACVDCVICILKFMYMVHVFVCVWKVCIDGEMFDCAYL